MQLNRLLLCLQDGISSNFSVASSVRSAAPGWVPVSRRLALTTACPAANRRYTPRPGAFCVFVGGRKYQFEKSQMIVQGIFDCSAYGPSTIECFFVVGVRTGMRAALREKGVDKSKWSSKCKI